MNKSKAAGACYGISPTSELLAAMLNEGGQGWQADLAA